MDAVIAEIRERIDEIAMMAGVPRRPWKAELPKESVSARGRGKQQRGGGDDPKADT